MQCDHIVYILAALGFSNLDMWSMLRNHKLTQFYKICVVLIINYRKGNDSNRNFTFFFASKIDRIQNYTRKNNRQHEIQ